MLAGIFCLDDGVFPSLYRCVKTNQMLYFNYAQYVLLQLGLNKVLKIDRQSGVLFITLQFLS